MTSTLKRIPRLIVTFMALTVTWPMVVVFSLWSALIDWMLRPYHGIAVPDTNHCVIVTGCGTGIGKATVLDLAQRGYYVFAGIRNASEIAKYSPHPRVKAIHLDINMQETVDAAAELINQWAWGDHKRRVVALVNNAGIGMVGPLETCDDNTMRQMFNVNLVGTAIVTRKFLPLLREHQPSRIVFIGSTSASLPAPGVAAYSASKAGLRSLAMSLRQELAPCGISVSLVEPGPTQTSITKKLSSGLLGSIPPYMGLSQLIHLYLENVSSIAAVPCETSTNPAIRHAIMSGYPKAEYAPAFSAALQTMAGRLPIELQPGQIIVLIYHAIHQMQRGWMPPDSAAWTK